MQFENSNWFYLLFFLPMAVLLFYAWVEWRKKKISRIGDEQLVLQLMPRNSLKRKGIKLAILLIALASMITGLANLRMGSKKEKVSGESAEVIICFDVSNSMLAEDVKPSRIMQAKLTASQLIEKLASNKIGLIVFAGNSYVQMPLTNDARAALMYLNTINTGMVSAQGTAIGNALETALKEFEEGGDEKSGKGKAIIIITDGESHDENAIAMAKKAADENIEVITVGVGTPAGGPIPLKSGNTVAGFKKDRAGNIVLTKLNENALREIADASGGVYLNAAEGRKAIQTTYAEIDKLDKTKDNEYAFTEYANHFQIFLGLGLMLITLEFFMSDKKPLWIRKIRLFDAKNK